jgi:hypothetical protein
MSDLRPWLRRRRPGPGLDLDFIAYWALTGAFIALGLLVLDTQIRGYPDPSALFSDASLYFAATEAWVSGGNPWAVTGPNGITFAGWPPTLLLNLPLLPFGPDVARPFWALADVAGWLVVMWRLRLGPWWILFPPFVEGLFPASPDPALAGAMVIGGAWLAALAKPYSIPSILADGHWRAVAVAGLLVLATFLVLPWGLFISQLPAIQAALAAQSRDVSAWGQPVLMVLVAIALASLGVRTALRLVVPTLWPSAQLHYSVFSARAGAESAALAVALATPGLTAQLVVVYAVVIAARRWAGGREIAPLGSQP